MSLLIKGMDMPSINNVYNAKLDVRPSGVRLIIQTSFEIKHVKEYDCIDLPTPHGRLIDADGCIRAILNDKDIGMYKLITIGTLIEALKAAPTIIESEGTE